MTSKAGGGIDKGEPNAEAETGADMLEAVPERV